MKNIIISMMIMSMSLVFAGCRGSNSTYTTESVTTTVETQAETPTINNGNGPITTVPTNTTTGEENRSTETTSPSNPPLQMQDDKTDSIATSDENAK